jgi:hypothetical protein
VPGLDERRAGDLRLARSAGCDGTAAAPRPARHAAPRPSSGARRYPVLIGALVALAVVPTAALVMAGTQALNSTLDARRPFVADRAHGPVVVGPDGVPDGQQRRPAVDGRPLLTAPSSAGASSDSSGSSGAQPPAPESTRSPVTESCTGEHVGSAPGPGGPGGSGGPGGPGGAGGAAGSGGSTGPGAPAGSGASGGSGQAAGGPDPGPTGAGSTESGAPSPDPSPGAGGAGDPLPSPTSPGTPESGQTGGGFDLDLGIIHIHVG